MQYITWFAPCTCVVGHNYRTSNMFVSEDEKTIEREDNWAKKGALHQHIFRTFKTSLTDSLMHRILASPHDNACHESIASQIPKHVFV